MGYSFDGVAKVITLSDLLDLDVMDMWSRWVDWMMTSDNSKYPVALSQLGGNTIDSTAGTSIPIYIFIHNGWRIKPQESDHTLNVKNGIIVIDGGGDPFINTIGDFTVRVNYQQPVQAIAISTSGGYLGPTAEEIATAVWNKILNGTKSASDILKEVSDGVDEAQALSLIAITG